MEDVHWWYLSTHRFILNKLNSSKHCRRILDAGCGTGGLLKKIGESNRVTGFDASADAVKKAFERPGLSGMIALADTGEIPFQDCTFDAVTCIDVIYHAGVDEQKAVHEMHRVLKPGGLFILQVPAFELLRGGHDEAVHTRKRYRKSEIYGLFNEHGFKTIAVFYRFFWLFFPAVFIRHFTRGSGKSDLKPLHPKINNIFFQISSFFDRDPFIRFPFGTSLFAIGEKIS